MKRLFKTFLTVVLVLMLSATVTYAFTPDYILPTATKTASAVCVAVPSYFYSIMVTTDGTNAVTVNIYDNASAASGTKLIPSWVVTTSASNRVQTLSMNPPVPASNGIYVDTSTSGTVAYMLYYRNQR
jgi:hypothetical protein